MKPPPLLTGDEAKANFVLRELTGQYTKADWAVHTWIWEEYAKHMPLSIQLQEPHAVILYLGKQIWPPE